MGNTYSNGYEMRDVNAALCYCQVVQSSLEMPIAPPPFNLVAIPSRLITALVNAICKYWANKKRPHRGVGAAMSVAKDPDVTPNELDEIALRERITAYMDDNLAESEDSSERFRSIVVKSLRAMETKGDGVEARIISALKQHMDEMTGKTPKDVKEDGSFLYSFSNS